MMNLEEKKDYNIRLFPIYKMFAWDLLFYYAISFLFLTEVKHFSPSNVVLVDVCVYTFFKFLMQIPATIFVDKLGKKQSLVIANTSLCISILLIIFSFNIYVLIIANLFMAFAFSVKSLAESNILNDAITDDEKKQRLFSTIEGKATSFYYYFNAASCLVTGFLYTISPYLPVSLCLCICLFSTYLSTRFYSLHSHSPVLNNVPKPHERFKEYFKELRYAFRYITHSSRLRCLILFYGIFQGIIVVTNTIDRSLLTDLKIAPAFFGIIYAALAILSGIASNLPTKLHNRFRNRMLTFLAVLMVSSCIMSGFFVIAKASRIVILFAVIFSLAIRAFIKGPFYTIYKQYLNSFAGPSIITKIYTATYSFENLFTCILAFTISSLLDFSTTAFCFVLIGLVSTAVFYFLLKYMKKRIGLKPEQYRREDIHFIGVK